MKKKTEREIQVFALSGLFEKGHHKGQKLELALTNKFNT